ncbi:MAG: cytochrome P450 [Novosphingobium sp.]
MEPRPAFTHWSQVQDRAEIAHIPGEDGWPVIGTTFKLLADPTGYSERMVAAHGRVFRNRSFGRSLVLLVGAEANELVLLDRDKLFSSAQGWGPVLDLVFPRGLMLMDFEAHRVDRRALGIAFKPGPMRHYADALGAGIAERLPQWAGDLRFYPAIKALTLDLAATSFLGLPLGPEAERLNRAFVAMVQASIGVVRRPVPFTAMGRGVAGRRELVAWFTPQVLARRAGEGAGQDMFSQFCRATTEDGEPLPVEAVVDHMIFLMMAAHDTITSSATHLVWLLAKHPEWQDKLRAEAVAATGGSGRLAYDDLGRMELTEMAFKEALRLLPPVPSIMRRALRDFDFGGYHIPAGTPVTVSVTLVHRMAEHWPEPERFDPLRFTPEATAARHKYAWVPFGGGAHMCLGLHFAYMQVKLLMAQLLTRYRIEVAEGYAPKWQAWPIPKPRDGLEVRLVDLS